MFVCSCSRASKPFAFLLLINCWKRPYYPHSTYFVHTGVYGGPARARWHSGHSGQDTSVLRGVQFMGKQVVSIQIQRHITGRTEEDEGRRGLQTHMGLLLDGGRGEPF